MPQRLGAKVDLCIFLEKEKLFGAVSFANRRNAPGTKSLAHTRTPPPPRADSIGSGGDGGKRGLRHRVSGTQLDEQEVRGVRSHCGWR